MTENLAAGDRPVDESAYTTTLTGRRWLTDETFEVEMTRPKGFDFVAGQNVCFLHGEFERYYALTSAPPDDNIQLCVQKIPGGVFTPHLAEAEIGTALTFSGPHGYFTFRPSDRSPVFIATEIGIAPFISFVRSGVSGFSLIHLVSRSENLLYADLFRKAAASYFPCPAGVPDTGMGPDPLPTHAVIEHLRTQR